jgi:hypothetical protein
MRKLLMAMLLSATTVSAMQVPDFTKTDEIINLVSESKEMVVGDGYAQRVLSIQACLGKDAANAFIDGDDQMLQIDSDLE